MKREGEWKGWEGGGEREWRRRESRGNGIGRVGNVEKEGG